MMASVTIRLDDDKRDELERLARSRGSTVSDMLRVAIDGLLRRDVPLSLDMVARRQLALSHEILAHLDTDPDARREHRRAMRVLAGGYTNEYPREFYAFDTESSAADAKLVMDILDMFRALEEALAELGEETVAELGEGAAHLLTFDGFDHQDPYETRLSGFAEHLISEGRWEQLAHHFGDDPDVPDCLNSHHPVLPLYRRMLHAFEDILSDRAGAGTLRGADRGGVLTLDELTSVFAATRYPDKPAPAW
jgi:uncharacterized protein